MLSRVPFDRLQAVTQTLGGKAMAHLRQGRLLHGWLPLLLGPALGAVMALLIVNGSWELAIPVILLVPAVLLLSRYPFAVIMIYLSLFPFFSTRLDRSVYYVLHGAMFPVTLVYVLLIQGLGMGRRKEPIRIGPSELAMVVFLGLAVGNILLASSNPAESLEMLYDRMVVPFCAYWLVRVLAPGERDLKRLLWVAIFTIIIQVAIGFVAWFRPQALPSQWLGRAGERTTGSFGNAAVYATTLMFLSLLLFHQAMQSGSAKLRTVLLSVFSLGLFGVLFTFSRGSWLAGVAVLLGLVLLYPKATIRLVVLFAMLGFILGNSLLADEVGYAARRLAAEDTAQGRVVLLNTGLGMARAKPLFGWGYDNYDSYDDDFKVPVGDIPVRSDPTSHNTYMTLVIELGLVAFLMYVFPVAYWLGASLKAWGRLPQHGFWSRRLLSMLWLVILAHVIVSNFMDMIRFRPFGTTMWWLTLGLIANMVYPLLRPRGPGDSGDSPYPTGQARTAERLSGPSGR
jgi:O-antigen ligase